MSETMAVPGEMAAMFLRLPAVQREKLLASLTGEEMVELDGDINARVRSSLEDWCLLALSEKKQRPAAHHRLLIAALEDVAAGRCRKLLVEMPPGSAKALALDTPIATPLGWSTMGSLRIGDEVFDEGGSICRVTWKSPVWRDRPVFAVTTDCGDRIVADAEHEWLVRLCGKRPVFKIKETRELARPRSKRPMIARAKALDLPGAVLWLSPWVLGLWLGDGTSAAGEITAGDEDRDWLRAEVERCGYPTRDRTDGGCRLGIEGIRDLLVRIGVLGNKHIPGVYLRGSVEQRLALLQGLIDSDGTVCRDSGSVTFCSTKRGLAYGVRELVRSLGRKAGWSEGRATLNGKDCGPVWRVSFYHAEAARLPRKAALCREQWRTPDTYIDVEPAGTADTVCIEVDSPSHLFLCGRSMTPTHNSTYVSGLFPPWFLARAPGLSAVGTSHTSSLADYFSRRAMEHVDGFGDALGVSLVTRAADDWSLSNGGEYKAAGVGGALTGRRADIAVIDDPVKDREQADSPTERAKTVDWYENVLLTRLKPEGCVIIVMTRWHEADLGGFVQERDPGEWRVLRIPMEAEDVDDPLGRAVGEPLWSEYFQPGQIADAKKDPRKWAALYQQRPAPAEGVLFKTGNISIRGDLPPIKRRVRAWDLAATEAGARAGAGVKRRTDPDWTAGVLLGLTQQGRYVVLDVKRIRGGPEAVYQLIQDTAKEDGRSVEIGLPQDPGQSGKMQVQHLTSLLAGYKITSSTENGKKDVRAAPAASQCNVGNMSMMQGQWNAELLEELKSFPAGKFDDQVDALSRAFGMLVTAAKPTHSMMINYGAR